jgi:hypothetical protein
MARGPRDQGQPTTAFAEKYPPSGIMLCGDYYLLYFHGQITLPCRTLASRRPPMGGSDLGAIVVRNTERDLRRGTTIR